MDTLATNNQQVVYSHGYLDFITKHLDIHDKIYDIIKGYAKFHDFANNYLRVNDSIIYNGLLESDYITKNDIEYVTTVLIIWSQNYCTFFKKYGRLIYNYANKNNIYYFDKSHKKSRKGISLENLI
tara:strand:+ start:13109 stop:13486 length:378 start_codon:yes stop_codon:yes gene_type:complete